MIRHPTKLHLPNLPDSPIIFKHICSERDDSTSTPNGFQNDKIEIINYPRIVSQHASSNSVEKIERQLSVGKKANSLKKENANQNGQTSET